MEYTPFAAYPNLLLTEFQAGNPPDLLTTPAGGITIYSTYALGSQGKLLDLTGSPWGKRMVPVTRKYVTVKNRIYGFPAAVVPSGLLYNIDVFKQLGLSVPKDSAALLTLCQKIKAAGKTPIVLYPSSLGSTVPSNTATAYVYAKDPKWTLHRIQKKTTFASSPLWRAGLDELVTLRDAGCFNSAPAATSQAAAYQSLANGQAAMAFGIQSEIPSLQSINPNVHLAVTPYPSLNANDTTGQLATAQFILSGAKATAHPKEVKEFIDFFGRPKQDALFAKVANAIAPDDFNKAILPASAQDYAPYIKAHKTIFSPQADWPRPDKGLYSPGLTAQIAGLFTGQRTVDQILQNMDALWDSP